MIRPTVITILALWLAVQPVPASADSEIVRFPVTSFMGESIMLSGRLTRPEGDGPFPAVVLLHGCNGTDLDDPWVEQYWSSWGYVFLQIDSFGPRDITQVCEGNDQAKANPSIRARDAHAGKDFLANLPNVDGDRIAAMGWSHGGMTVLNAVSNRARN